MIQNAQKIVQATDAVIAHAYLAVRTERNAIISFLFHALFKNQCEIESNQIDPLQRTTVMQLRTLIRYYLHHGYHFIGPDDLLAGLDPGNKYVQLTFDDGYFNNSLAIPVLEEFGVPGLFFISTDNMRQNKCFWWDVLHRERLATGATARQIYQEAVALKRLTTEQIEAQLSARFGPRAFEPRSDIDRPFNPRELADFARNPFVHIGNHTANHAILTNYDDDAIHAQLQSSQDALTGITGLRPIAIAYPNGGYDQRVIAACRDVGLQLGYTVRPEKVSIARGDLFQLGRFAPHGFTKIERQCRTCRSDFSVYRSFRDVYLRLCRPGSV